MVARKSLISSDRCRAATAVALLLLLTLFCAGIACAAEEKRGGITRKDRCPVCGMFVCKYPKWIARMEFQDGSRYFYDGAKDLFKHYRHLQIYTPERALAEVTGILVTDYYTLKLIDGREAYYVIGSKILGPMGHELIPFEDQAAAREFLEDHQGERILRFDDVSDDVLKALDAAQQGERK